MASTSVFGHASIVPAPADEVFRWHERPAALDDLLPPRFVRVEERSGGVGNGERLTLSMGVGPIRLRWEARHFGYIAGRQFCDEQVSGPFAVWRHKHRMAPIGAAQTLYEDRVEYALTGSATLNRIADVLLRPLLAVAFARRHRTVRKAICRARSRSAPLAAHAMLLAVGLVAGARPANAQDTAGMGTLRGIVREASGAPVADVAVCVPDTSQCAVSEGDGRFTLAVRPGDYTLEVTAPATPLIVSQTIQIRAGLEQDVEIALPPSDGVQQTVTVTAPEAVVAEEVKTSGRLIGRDAIATGAGSLQDVSRYVQSLPGVAVGSNDFRNDLFVRGGSPLENLYIVDNIEIPNINTFATFASAGGTVGILDVQLIDSVTFLTGGFPAPFGNRTSSVLQIAQREGRRDRAAGLATVGFAGAGVVAEGPLGPSRKGSWIVSARRSFLDLFTDDTGIGGVPVLYTLNGKAVYDLSSRDRVWAVHLTGVDDIRLGLTENSEPDDELSNLDIQYAGRRNASGINWQRVYRRGVGLFGVTHAYARVDQRVSDLLRDGLPAPDTPVADQIAAGQLVFRERSSEMETTISYAHTVAAAFLGKIQTGGALKVSRIDYDTASPFGTDSPFFPVADTNPFAVHERFTTTQAGVYAQASRPLTTRLSATAGLRVDHYSLLDATTAGPRAGAEYRLTRRMTLRASYGRYHQQPFFLFLVAYPENRDLKPFRADHFVGGLTVELDRSTRVGVETYRKRYRDYPVSGQIPSLSLANIGDTFAVRDVLFPMTAEGRGTVAGVEASVERRDTPGSRWSGEANLAFSRSRYAGLDGVLRPGSYDYPVVANVLGTFRLSPAWSLSSRMAYLAGRPFTPLDASASAAQRRAVYDLSRVNDDRTPDYFRLDVRIERAFTRGDRRAVVFAGVQNVSNRENVAGYSWDRRNNALRTSTQLGVFPILGVEWPF